MQRDRGKTDRVRTGDRDQDAARRRYGRSPGATGARAAPGTDGGSARAAGPAAALQGRYGNQAVQRFVEDGTPGSTPAVGRPDDRYEREADRAAEAVARGADTATTGPTVSGAVAPRLQRMCRRCRGRFLRGESLDCEDCERELDSDGPTPDSESGGGRLQRAGAAPAPDTAPPVVEEVLRKPGRPLDAEARRGMERQFGRAFDGVRVHTGRKAAESARAVNARAYTVGRDVVFDAGQYAPGTPGGRRLLAHELTHVVQQGGTRRAPGSGPISVDDPDSRLERAASAGERARVDAGGSLARPTLQRQPTTASDPAEVCYDPDVTPPSQEAGTCLARRPGDCATYEQWLNSFDRLRTFEARDTAPGGTEETGFDVIGEQAHRPVDEGEAAEGEEPVPMEDAEIRDRFVDHPTDEWVRTCLPGNLRATAYQLPADCADVAIILRHVWLAAHRRTETYEQGDREWTVGDRAGEAAQDRIGDVIGEMYSGNVDRMLNPYADAQGNPLRSFDEVEDLLHPGDVLVWEHHEDGIDEGRTGGHTQTIVDVTRQGGEVTAIRVAQGNMPIFGDQAEEIREHIGRGAPSEGWLRAAPGRRVETNALSGNSLGNGNQEGTEDVWTWADGHTTLVAAGPPEAVDRPAMRTEDGERRRRLSDWHGPLRRASARRLQPVFEAALLEARAAIESGRTDVEDAVVELGRKAGERLWKLATEADDLGNRSHFEPLFRLRGLIQAIGDPGGSGVTSAETPQAATVERIFERVDEAFRMAARGASTISFDDDAPEGVTEVRVLVTGFDPFSGGDGPDVPAGVANPSGAAALALDGESWRAGDVFVSVESVVLPVNYGDFSTGMVEDIVGPQVEEHGVDVVLTTSLDPGLGPDAPVDLERFAVGVHTAGGRLGPIPAAEGGSLGPAIIRPRAPLSEIALETERSGDGGQSAIARPTVDTAVTFRFPTEGIAEMAIEGLGLSTDDVPVATREDGSADVTISDRDALRQILRTNQRWSGGSGIAFLAGDLMVPARVVRGPGGNFLSNEVSYRVLRMLAAGERTDVQSFHVHVPRVLESGSRIPQGTETRAERRERREALAAATDVKERIESTLRRMIRVVAERAADQSEEESTGGGR